MKNIPIKKFRLYPIEVPIWKFIDDDTGRVSFSTKVEKNIKDKDTGEYVTKAFLYPDEVAVASVLLAQAAGWISQQVTKPKIDEGDNDEVKKPF